MMMCAPEDEQEFVTRTIDKAEITSRRPRPNHYGVTYDDALVLKFFIMKKDGCNAQEEFRMSGDDIHFVRSWLESSKLPTELVVPLEEDTITTHYYGSFTSVQPYIIDSECYGLNLEFTCDSPFGYSDEHVLMYEVDSAETAITDSFINISSEENDRLYPKIVINSSSTFGEDEIISFKNESDDDRTMVLTLPYGLSSLTIDCEKRIITDDSGQLVTMSDIGVVTPVNGEYNTVSTDMFIFNWFGFVHGDNDIVITPGEDNTISTVEIKLRFKVKSGGF